jgi:hypothetical protein
VVIPQIDGVKNGVGLSPAPGIIGMTMDYYADLLDHDELRHDPVLCMLLGKLGAKDQPDPLAGESTLNRLEDLDLVVFPDQLHVRVRRKSPTTLLAMGWCVVTKFVGIVGQPTMIRLMPWLRPTRMGVLSLFPLVRGRRLRRTPRCLIRWLEPRQINQLALAQLLQISAIHGHMDSEIGPRGKRMGNYLPISVAVTFQGLRKPPPLAFGGFISYRQCLTNRSRRIWHRKHRKGRS